MWASCLHAGVSVSKAAQFSKGNTIGTEDNKKSFTNDNQYHNSKFPSSTVTVLLP